LIDSDERLTIGAGYYKYNYIIGNKYYLAKKEFEKLMNENIWKIDERYLKEGM
jgi:hypothetical protein